MTETKQDIKDSEIDMNGPASKKHGLRTGSPVLSRLLYKATKHHIRLGLASVLVGVVLVSDTVEVVGELWHRITVSPLEEALQSKIDNSARLIRREAIEHLLGPPAVLDHDHRGTMYATYSLGQDGWIRHVYRDDVSVAFCVGSSLTPTIQLGDFSVELNRSSFFDVIPGQVTIPGDPVSDADEHRVGLSNQIYSQGWQAESGPKNSFYMEWAYGGLHSEYTTILLYASDWGFAQLDPIYVDGEWQPAPPLDDRESCRRQLRRTVAVGVVGVFADPAPSCNIVDFITRGYIHR
jgi:hypothetical protein